MAASCGRGRCPFCLFSGVTLPSKDLLCSLPYCLPDSLPSCQYDEVPPTVGPCLQSIQRGSSDEEGPDPKTFGGMGKGNGNFLAFNWQNKVSFPKARETVLFA